MKKNECGAGRKKRKNKWKNEREERTEKRVKKMKKCKKKNFPFYTFWQWLRHSKQRKFFFSTCSSLSDWPVFLHDVDF